MAAPLTPGLSPAETSFLCEMTSVTVVPRSTLPALHLLSGPTPALNPPHRASLPLWLALLLKKQDRADILPPPWLSVEALEAVLGYENSMPGFAPAPKLGAKQRADYGARGGQGLVLSPPFLGDGEADANVGIESLPYHWLEVAHLLLDAAWDNVPHRDAVRRLLKNLQEARAAKLRGGVEVLEGGREVTLNGVGGLEISENRAFVVGVVDGLRKIGASKEASRREREGEERERGYGGDEGDEDEDML
ncbi:MAG: DNA replication protein psf2 [Stictis urceolatum]|nr:DNA replication protein psf2 [Stictis urceolata]